MEITDPTDIGHVARATPSGHGTSFRFSATANGRTGLAISFTLGRVTNDPEGKGQALLLSDITTNTDEMRANETVAAVTRR